MNTLSTLQPLFDLKHWCYAGLILLAACRPQYSPLSSIEVARNGINGGALSRDGQYSVVGSVFHGGSLWRNSDAERLYNWNHSKDSTDDRIIISADINATNQRALTADAATLVLWDVSTGAATRFWTSPAEVLDSKLDIEGRYALLGLADHSAVIFDAIQGGITRKFSHKGRVRSVDLSDDNLIAITGSEDHSAIIWQVSNSKPLFTIQHKEDVQFVKLSYDGRYAVTAAQFDRAELWGVEKQRSIAQLPLKKERLKRGLYITSARFSDDSKQLLIGYPNRTIELRTTQSLKLLKTWTLPKRKHWQPTNAAVIDVAFDQQDKQYRAMSSDGFVHLLQ